MKNLKALANLLQRKTLVFSSLLKKVTVIFLSVFFFKKAITNQRKFITELRD